MRPAPKPGQQTVRQSPSAETISGFSSLAFAFGFNASTANPNAKACENRKPPKGMGLLLPPP
jgi:hypothetical protein